MILINRFDTKRNTNAGTINYVNIPTSEKIGIKKKSYNW